MQPVNTQTFLIALERTRTPTFEVLIEGENTSVKKMDLVKFIVENYQHCIGCYRGVSKGDRWGQHVWRLYIANELDPEQVIDFLAPSFAEVVSILDAREVASASEVRGGMASAKPARL